MSHVFATLFKEKYEARVGLKLRKVGDDIVIVNINEGSMASFTKLKLGMKIVNINNVSMIGKEGKDAVQALRDALGEIWIVAQTNGVEDIPMANVFIGSTEIMNQCGLSDYHVMTLSAFHVNNLEDLILLQEKADYDTIFGMDDQSNFLVKRRLAAFSKFIRNGGSISDVSFTNIVQYNENVEARRVSDAALSHTELTTHCTSRGLNAAAFATNIASGSLVEVIGSVLDA